MTKKTFKYFDTNAKTEDIVERVSNFSEYHIPLEIRKFLEQCD